MIKEILYLEDYINKYKYDEKAIINGNRLTTPAMLDYLEAKELIDYITNLQEENERLKELCDKYEEEHSTAFNLWTMKMKEMPDYEEKMNYKSRCKKAIEYIENNKKETSSHFNGKEYVYRNFTLCCEPNDLLNILKGSDNINDI